MLFIRSFRAVATGAIRSFEKTGNWPNFPLLISDFPGPCSLGDEQLGRGMSQASADLQR